MSNKADRVELQLNGIIERLRVVDECERQRSIHPPLNKRTIKVST